ADAGSDVRDGGALERRRLRRQCAIGQRDDERNDDSSHHSWTVRFRYTFNPVRSASSFSFRSIISCQVTSRFWYAAVRPRMVVRLLRTLGATVALVQSPRVMLS